MDYTVQNCQHKGFLTQICKCRGLPLQAQKQITVKPDFQKIVESGISCNITENTRANVEAPWKKSTIEPWISPVILLCRNNNNLILCSNFKQERYFY